MSLSTPTNGIENGNGTYEKPIELVFSSTLSTGPSSSSPSSFPSSLFVSPKRTFPSFSEETLIPSDSEILSHSSSSFPPFTSPATMSSSTYSQSAPVLVTQLQIKQMLKQLRESVPLIAPTTSSSFSSLPSSLVPSSPRSSSVPSSPSRIDSSPSYSSSSSPSSHLMAPKQQCRPSSVEDFFVRVDSFRDISRWFGQSDRVEPLFCARYGWALHAAPSPSSSFSSSSPSPASTTSFSFNAGALECQTCRALAFLPSALSIPTLILDPETTKKTVEGFRSILRKEGHKTHCPWIDNPCSKALTSIPTAPPSLVCSSFVQRVEQLLPLIQHLGGDGEGEGEGEGEREVAKGDSLRILLSFDFGLSLVETLQTILGGTVAMQVSEAIALFISPKLSALLEGNGEQEKKQKERTEKHLSSLVLLAICGWTLTSLPLPHVRGTGPRLERPCLFCNFCRRVVPLWNFILPERKESSRDPLQLTLGEEEDREISPVSSSPSEQTGGNGEAHEGGKDEETREGRHEGEGEVMVVEREVQQGERQETKTEEEDSQVQDKKTEEEEADSESMRLVTESDGFLSLDSPPFGVIQTPEDEVSYEERRSRYLEEKREGESEEGAGERDKRKLEEGDDIEDEKRAEEERPLKRTRKDEQKGTDGEKDVEAEEDEKQNGEKSGEEVKKDREEISALISSSTPTSSSSVSSSSKTTAASSSSSTNASATSTSSSTKKSRIVPDEKEVKRFTLADRSRLQSPSSHRIRRGRRTLKEEEEDNGGLDPVREHRWWCPWLRQASSSPSFSSSSSSTIIREEEEQEWWKKEEGREALWITILRVLMTTTTTTTTTTPSSSSSSSEVPTRDPAEVLSVVQRLFGKQTH